MKKILIYGALAIAAASLSSCKEEGLGRYDTSWILNNNETMILEASSTNLKLDAEALDDVALTFTWTPAREMSDDYVLTYITYLDLKTNQFSETTRIRKMEMDGTYEKSYTNDELQKIIVDNYGKSISEITTISFKVIAKWEGGDKFIMPETRTVDVDVQPYRPITFDADKVFLGGDAVRGIRPSSDYTVTKTPENEFIYAGEFEMVAGRMTIPIEYDGVTRYICPNDRVNINVPDDDQVGGMPAGTQEYKAMVMDLDADEVETDLPAWILPSGGYWRVIIDTENKTVKFFSPKNRLEPFVARFFLNGVEKNGEVQKTINTLYTYGAHDWNGSAMDFKQSQIDPQILVWKGSVTWNRFNFKSGKSGSDFTIIKEGDLTSNIKVSNIWTIAPTEENFSHTDDPNSPAGQGNTGGDGAYSLGKWMDIDYGASWHRGSYFCNFDGYELKANGWERGPIGVKPSKISQIVIDLRNKKMILY